MPLVSLRITCLNPPPVPMGKGEQSHVAMEGAQHLCLKVLLGLLASRPQTTTEPVPVPSYQMLAGQPWCCMRECGELHCGQRLLRAATPLWFITCSERPLPCPLWDLTLTAAPTSPWRWEVQYSEDNLPGALGPEQHRSSPGLRWDTSLHWEGGPGMGVLAYGQSRAGSGRRGMRGMWEWGCICRGAGGA